jgi:hypothetical protein
MDIPMSDLLIALGIAALIGAAGGWVYAGILGSKRRDSRRSGRRLD